MISGDGSPEKRITFFFQLVDPPTDLSTPHAEASLGAEVQERKGLITILFVELSLAPQYFAFRIPVFFRGMVFYGKDAEEIGPELVGVGYKGVQHLEQGLQAKCILRHLGKQYVRTDLGTVLKVEIRGLVVDLDPPSARHWFQ